jgi:hypothetical protein
MRLAHRAVRRQQMGSKIDLQNIAARYRLGLENGESLVSFANEMVKNGEVDPFVIALATQSDLNMSEVAPLFERMCNKMSIKIPTVQEAIGVALYEIISDIASGEQEPMAGLRRFGKELYLPYMSKEPVAHYAGDSRLLEGLVSAFWAYDDLKERPNELSFNNKYGKDAADEFDKHVQQLAREWLKSH